MYLYGEALHVVIDYIPSIQYPDNSVKPSLCIVWVERAGCETHYGGKVPHTNGDMATRNYRRALKCSWDLQNFDPVSKLSPGLLLPSLSPAGAHARYRTDRLHHQLPILFIHQAGKNSSKW